MVHRFGQDFVIVASVMQRTGGGGLGLWNEEHGFYFDVIRHDTERVPLKIYSMVGLVPLFAATVIEPSALAKLPVVMQTVGNVLNSREFLRSILPTFIEPEKTARGSPVRGQPGSAGRNPAAWSRRDAVPVGVGVRSLRANMLSALIHSRSGAAP